MGYFLDLKNGKWQKKRLEIMQRDVFRCIACHGENNLAVHHIYYDNAKKPWEYDNETMVTLCDSCHNKIHTDLAKLGGLIALDVLLGKIDLPELSRHG